MNLCAILARSAVTVVAAAALPLGAVVVASPASAETTSASTGAARVTVPIVIHCPLSTLPVIVWPPSWRCPPSPGPVPLPGPFKDADTVVWQ